jgi:hypothetical protein
MDSLPFNTYLEYIGAKFRVNELRAFDLNGGDDELKKELDELEAKCDAYLNWAISPSTTTQGENDNG